MSQQGGGAQEAMQKFGRFLSGMVMPNIGAFIAWGFLTALFIPTGWMPNEYLAQVGGPMSKWLIPLLIGYSGGAAIYGHRGGVMAAIATSGIIAGSDIPMFLGAMIMGPLGGCIIKKFDDAIRDSIPGGFEMLVNNFSLGILGGILAMIAYAVVGPVVSGISHAGRSLRSALAGLRALPGWAEAPNPVHADDLLPERLLAGDELAGEQILSLVHAPLHEMGDPFESTVATYLALGGSLEATARNLFVHANTVRYRLGRVSEQVGWDATNARDGLMLHMAIIVGRLAVGRED